MRTGFIIYDNHGRKQVTDNAIDLVYKNKILINGYFDNNYLITALQPLESKKIYRRTFACDQFYGNGYLYEFDFNYTVSSSNKYGLEVYDEKGNLTFTSNLLSLNIIDDVYIEDIRQTEGGKYNCFNKNYNSNEIAVIPLISAGWWSGDDFLTEAYIINNGWLKLSFGFDMRDEPIAKKYVSNSFALHFLVIDTSNYK